MRTVAAVVAFVVCVHAALWALLQRHQAIANIENPLASVSYSPYTRSQHPDHGDRPTEQQIRADLKVLSSYTQAIRTYSTTGRRRACARHRGGVRAESHARHLDRQERGAQRAGNPGQRSLSRAAISNVNAIVVGNETIYRAEKSVPSSSRSFSG